MTEKLTSDRLKELLDYDPATGVFIWRARPANSRMEKVWNGRHAGKVAGSLRLLSKSHKTKYRVIAIDSKPYLGHRLAWLYVYGEWPTHEVDHRDLDGGNNSIKNLRPATRGQNAANRGVHKNNTSGFKGIYQNKKGGRWVAQRNGYIGSFDAPEAAHAAYMQTLSSDHPEFARAS